MNWNYNYFQVDLSQSSHDFWSICTYIRGARVELSVRSNHLFKLFEFNRKIGLEDFKNQPSCFGDVTTKQD